MNLRRVGWLAAAAALALPGLAAPRTVTLVEPPANPSPRVQHGLERLAQTLVPVDRGGSEVRIEFQRRPVLAPEGFALRRNGPVITIGFGDDTGLLYGCLDLARRVRETGTLPAELEVEERPSFTLRGPCLGLQKTYLLPGRRVYEYPYTPELFPFFYDPAFWREYLDLLVENRMNVLFLWNGHPFSSLVRVAEYPEAVEVPPEVFARNVEMFRAITTECDRRGIWLVQMFYNILLPAPLAAKHGLSTQLRAPTPLAADYTRRAIAEFVRQYPHVGLMPCLGEALQGTANQVTWATQTLLPGVLDGMRAAGLAEPPPVVFRTHAMDPEAILPEALKVYPHLYTETKYNGESLTTWEPRGRSRDTHLAMSRLGPHLVNVHILSNLEPFRYGATEFIRKSVLAARDRLGATGLHLYPLAYWSWPDAPDATDPPLRQWERDWIWFEAWARYAWNPDREPGEDRAHWVGRLAARYGTSEAAADILAAYNAAGECAPRIIRRFGITEGNRQTMALGMTLDQLVSPEKYGEFPDLWESQAPPGERLREYVTRDLAGLPHEGETPPQIAREILAFSAEAEAAAARARPRVTRHPEEFARLANDLACIRALSQHYAAKVGAAAEVLRFRGTGEVGAFERARPLLAESLEHFRTLERLTRGTYRFANSMQTAMRRIPVLGVEAGRPANYHWSHLLPIYERELAEFDARLAALRAGGPAAERARTLATLRGVEFTVHTPGAEDYTVKAGARVFRDSGAEVQRLAAELDGLRGIRFSRAAADGIETVEFSTREPVRVLVGYAAPGVPGWRSPPRGETDAAAVDRVDTEPLLVDAVRWAGGPRIDVFAWTFPAGRHRLEPPGRGPFLVLGVVAASTPAASTSP